MEISDRVAKNATAYQRTASRAYGNIARLAAPREQSRVSLNFLDRDTKKAKFKLTHHRLFEAITTIVP